MKTVSINNLFIDLGEIRITASISLQKAENNIFNWTHSNSVSNRSIVLNSPHYKQILSLLSKLTSTLYSSVPTEIAQVCGADIFAY